MKRALQDEDLLRVLKRIGLAAAGQRETNPARSRDPLMWQEVGMALTKEQLQQLDPTSSELLDNQCLLLPHFTKDGTVWVPVVWVHFMQHGRFSLQLCVLGEGRRFGYRWESPEGTTEDGKHDYWHAQPIFKARTPGGKHRDLDIAAAHVSDHFPTFPIDATDAMGLVGAMLVSLYGETQTAKHVQDPILCRRLYQATHRRADDAIARPKKMVGKRAR